jgi:hypothetical protein
MRAVILPGPPFSPFPALSITPYGYNMKKDNYSVLQGMCHGQIINISKAENK